VDLAVAAIVVGSIAGDFCLAIESDSTLNRHLCFLRHWIKRGCLYPGMGYYLTFQFSYTRFEVIDAKYSPSYKHFATASWKKNLELRKPEGMEHFTFSCLKLHLRADLDSSMLLFKDPFHKRGCLEGNLRASFLDSIPTFEESIVVRTATCDYVPHLLHYFVSCFQLLSQ
jgi:hypothetical protein